MNLYGIALHHVDAPPTPISPFRPHDALFPFVNFKFSVEMKNGFVVIDIPENEMDEMVC